SEDYAREVFQKVGESVRAERLVIWSRERTSFSLLSRTAPDWIELGLDCDTALHLDRETFLARSGPVPLTYDLLGIREDNEVFRGREFSQVEGVLLDPARYATSFEHWLRLHAGARRIITSRTHSAIAGSILKKPTIMLPGSYHKNRSIWEYVLAERGVVWGENLEAPSFARRAKSLLRNKVLSLSRFSYKVNRFTMRAFGVPD
ncbi:MAG: polysaccharide pyruvyl transferase family protein, partial [Planctomycetaceae bacterium]